MDNITAVGIESARIIFRNFAGKETQFNAEGNRNFCVIIDPDIVDTLRADGWNIKTLMPKDPNDAPAYYLQVAVSYKNIPPKIFLISKGKKQLLNELNINILDWAEIANADVIIRPYIWKVGGRTGVKAYVKTMYITIAEDEFASKYQDVPEYNTDETV